MAFPYSGSGGNALSVAEGIDSQVGNALGQTQQWRTNVAASGVVNSQQAETVYQTLVALRSYVAAHDNTPGLAEAYVFLFPTLPVDFHPAAEWVVAKQAIGQFVTWFQDNWPERTQAGKPAFSQFIAASGELVGFSVNLNAAAKNELVARLDAVLAAFQTPA
jgi:hypothetical protein